MNHMQIPVQVIEAASMLRRMYGEHVEYLGEYQGAQAYYYRFPEDVTAGACPVYLYKDGTVERLSGDVAAYVLDLYLEDIDEVDIE